MDKVSGTSNAGKTGPWAKYQEAAARQTNATIPAGFRVVSTPASTPPIPEGFRVVSSPTSEPSIPDGFKVVEPNSIEGLIRGKKAAEPSALTDVAKAVPSGLVRGAAETVMAPATIGRMAKDGLNYVGDAGEDGIRYLLGLDPVSDIDRAKREEFRNGGVDGAISGAQDAFRAFMDDWLYKPQTTPGEHAGTIAEFAAPGGLPSRAVRNAPTLGAKAIEYGLDSLGNVIAPAVLSEGAGQMAEGTPYEGVARLAGAVIGNVGAAGYHAYNAPEMVLRRATGEMTDQQWDEARRLQNNDTGVALTGPEIISQVQGGGSALPNVQRAVEGSLEGRARTAPFFAERPAQVDNAANEMLDLDRASECRTVHAGAARGGECECCARQRSPRRERTDASGVPASRTAAAAAGGVCADQRRPARCCGAPAVAQQPGDGARLRQSR